MELIVFSRGQTLPLLSLANEPEGILTSFKSTNRLLYGYFESNGMGVLSV